MPGIERAPRPVLVLQELLLPALLHPMRRRETLTKKEERAERAFLGSLSFPRRETQETVVVALVGLVASGKSRAARTIAERIGAAVIEGDAIRVALRKEGESFARARLVAERVMERALAKGSNAVLDSDHIDPAKRASARAKARRAGAKLVFVRTICDLDVAIGRTLAAEYRDDPDDFFGGASSSFTGELKGSVVKIRELIRRLPHHYRWENRAGGRYVLRELPFRLAATLDATDGKSGEIDTHIFAERLKRGRA